MSPPDRLPREIAPFLKRLAKRIGHGFLGRAYSLASGRARPLRRLERVLISGYTGLGHFVMKTVLIRQIEELYPGCAVTIIAGNAFGTEHVLSGYRTLILKEESGAFHKLFFFLKLRSERFDAVFLPCDASPRFLLRGCALAGIPIRVGHVFPEFPVPSYYYNVQVPVRRGGVRSEIDLNLDLLEAVYGAPFRRRYRPAVDVDRRLEVLEAHGLKPRSYVAVQPGAANGMPTTKRWLEEHFRELLRRLLEAYPALQIVVLGDRGDAPIASRVCDGADSERLKNLAGRTDLPATKTLIAHSRFLICHDSGLLHLGNAIGVPVLAIYGPSDPDYYAVQLPTFHLLRERCDCPQQGLFPGLYDAREDESAERCPVPECMRRLSVDKVFAKCAEILEA